MSKGDFGMLFEAPLTEQKFARSGGKPAVAFGDLSAEASAKAEGGEPENFARRACLFLFLYFVAKFRANFCVPRRGQLK